MDSKWTRCGQQLHDIMPPLASSVSSVWQHKLPVIYRDSEKLSLELHNDLIVEMAERDITIVV